MLPPIGSTRRSPVCLGPGCEPRTFAAKRARLCRQAKWATRSSRSWPNRPPKASPTKKTRAASHCEASKLGSAGIRLRRQFVWGIVIRKDTILFTKIRNGAIHCFGRAWAEDRRRGKTELEAYVGRPRTEATEGEKIFCLNHP